ncbi:protein of unknown function [Natronincola peptidivorans]|uniref:IrrE N-terminal-like domain-containing protein n=1 Tax=Natronincola peptidivorans TaxID=426128 RepID=A0A1I0C6V8_9FIRM|nr:ImmA/IrrE family metallo-endopeptidase [Natronincola peptidivorans]SET15250.1 protein of unknown function [Natronincola peptidivorans]
MKKILLKVPRRQRSIEIARDFLKSKGNPCVPIPVEQHLMELSTLIKFRDEEEEGFGVMEASGRYRIYVNTSIIQGRDLWTYAHELAHIVLGHYDDFDYKQLSDRCLYYLDQEADYFVSEYLMPQYGFEDYFFFKGRPKYFNPQYIGTLKNFFGVSWTAMILRLHTLNYQDYKKSKEYIKDYKKKRKKLFYCKKS